ncbi:MAG TPA: 3-dehydroquinate synthase [Candidatus Binatia bacterium]|nr:3-dehydroquinate synthase [Candidatus Binatia bacterium]
MRNIILTGFMGTGKTTVGRLLAARTGRAFVDTDELIVQRTGKAIAGIFADEGAEHFRQLEREMARQLGGSQDLVIATGGRLMLDPQNAAVLAPGSLVLCLQATPDEIVRRIAAESARRPLLDVPNTGQRVAELLQERAEGYQAFSQVATNNRAPAQIVDDILRTYDVGQVSAPVQDADRLTVTHPQGGYDVLVGRGLLSRLPQLASLKENNYAVISDSHVSALFSPAQSNPPCVLVFEAGEQNKTLDTVRALYEQLLEAGLDRSATVVALGGGVVGDVGGFVAATYMRGLRLVQCPTSLLAMVDASVGGKTGVDLPQGKNLVGAFKQPAIVLADVDALRTLPPAQFSAGMAEVVKHGLLAGGDLLVLLEEADWRQEILFQPPNVGLLQDLIVAAVKVKRDVVQSDPYELGRRAILNLGHTFAHAIESISGYAISHGYAVAMGLVAAVRLSINLGHCESALQPRIERLLQSVYLPTRVPGDLDGNELLAAMSSDKKKLHGRLRFVLLRGIGDIFVSADVPRETVLRTLEEVRAP